MNDQYNYDYDNEPYEYEIFKRMIDEYEADTEDLTEVVKEIKNEQENNKDK